MSAVGSDVTGRADGARIIGHGVVTKWQPVALASKMLIQSAYAGHAAVHAQRMRASDYSQAEIMEYLEKQGLGGAALERRSLEEARLRGYEPYDRAESYNTLVNGGTNFMLLAITVAPGTFYNNANAALGVGDSNTAFALTQTNLQGAVNVTDRIRKAMNATFPSVALNVLTAQSTFATTEANFQWNEWGFFNNVTDAAGTMLNRAVANLGTKTSAVAWQLTITLTQN